MKASTARHIALGAFLALSASALQLHAQDKPNKEGTISVSGLGSATTTPDLATMSFSVVKQAETAAVAMSDNSAALSQVLDALRKAGIEERDLQTSNFSIQPVYRQFEPKDGVYPPPQITGYQVSNGVSIRVRDLSKLGEVIDTSVKLGINQGGDISFSKDDTAEVITEARKKAVSDAVEKAKTLSEAAGVKLGKIIEISEGMHRPVAQPIAYAAMAKARMEDAAPIAIGESAYDVVVNVTFAIDQ